MFFWLVWGCNSPAFIGEKTYFCHLTPKPRPPKSACPAVSEQCIRHAQDTLHPSTRRDVWGESSVSVDCHTCGYPDLAKQYCVMTSQRVVESNLFHSEISCSDQSCCYKEVIKEPECLPRPAGNCSLQKVKWMLLLSGTNIQAHKSSFPTVSE